MKPMPDSLIPAATYSIVAYDPDASQWGVAVQSHYFGTGRVVTWAEAGVGVVATQSLVEISYGPLGLELMRAGKTASEALAGLVAADARSDVRQVAMIDGQGNVAAHTGASCIPEAGHRIGKHFSVQANMMLKNTVWDAMADAFEGAKGDLAERMMVALEAAENEGGDVRGKQSAAMLVVSGEISGAAWLRRMIDLRVDDAPTPLVELRRQLEMTRAYSLANQASALLRNQSLGDARFGIAKQKFDEAMGFEAALRGNPELRFWYGIELASAGQWDDAVPHLRAAFSVDPNWRELVGRLPISGRLPDSAELIERIKAIS